MDWASPRSRRGAVLLDRIRAFNADVAVLTEVTLPFLEALGGFVATSHPDYGYSHSGANRKAAIWSARPIGDIDELGDSQMPAGRFVAGITSTNLGDIRVVSICIPWSHAHVSTGRKDRAVWEEHVRFIGGLSRVVANASGPTLIAGDFNQRIPRQRQPTTAFNALVDALNGLRCGTTGVIERAGVATIDHVAATPHLFFKRVHSIDHFDGDRRLTDHFGIACTIAQSPKKNPTS